MSPDVTLWTTWAVQMRDGDVWRNQAAWSFESKTAALMTMRGAKRNGFTVRLVRVLHEVVQ